MNNLLMVFAVAGCLGALTQEAFCAPAQKHGFLSEIAASAYGTCVVAAGDVWCWGKNSHGEIGVGSKDKESHPIPRKVTGLSGVTGLWAGAHSLCGLSAARLWCWGDKLPGSGLAPASVDLPTAGAIGPVAVGETHVCAQVAGRLHCWGNNDFGMLGTGDLETRTAPVATAVAVEALDVAATWDSTCALVTGDIVCWGSNRYGKLGKPEEIEIHSVPAVTVFPALQEGVTQIVGGCDSYCALKGGAVYCWGENGSCTLGRATDGNINPVPAEVKGLPADVVQLVPGNGPCSSHFCALTLGGALWCWGLNDAGQIGQDPALVQTSCTPVQVAGPLSNKKITLAGTGRSHTCAMADGELWCWGANDKGQLGRDTAGAATHIPGLAAAPWQR